MALWSVDKSRDSSSDVTEAFVGGGVDRRLDFVDKLGDFLSVVSACLFMVGHPGLA